MKNLNDSQVIISDLHRYRDSTNLVIASQLFEDKDRLTAFTTLYSLMRIVDDSVDVLFERPVSPEERLGIRNTLKEWEQTVSSAYSATPQSDVSQHLATIVRQFNIPHLLWEHFFRSMWMDFYESAFSTEDVFLAYCEGASVAATTIYLMLIGAKKNENGLTYDVSHFDFITTGRELGIWAYTVHILRDLKSDVMSGDIGRFLIPEDMMCRHGLNRDLLRESVANDRFTPTVKRFLQEFWKLGNQYGIRGLHRADQLARALPLNLQKVLCIIISIYSHLSFAIKQMEFDVIQKNPKEFMEDREVLIRKIMASNDWEELHSFWMITP